MLAFHHYDEKEVVEGKPMKDHLRFAMSLWHTFRGTGLDPFGPGTMSRPWEGAEDTVENAKNQVRCAFWSRGRARTRSIAFTIGTSRPRARG